MKQGESGLGKLSGLVLGLLIATGFGANAAEIKVLTARAGATVLEKIGPEFERATGIRLNVITGIGGAFVKRINDGEPFDVLITGGPLVDGLINVEQLTMVLLHDEPIRFGQMATGPRGLSARRLRWTARLSRSA